MGREPDEAALNPAGGERVIPVIERARKGVGQYWNL